MKNLKKTMALVIAGAMTLSTVGAFAATGDFSSTPDSSITVEGLSANDTAMYYQIVVEDKVNPENKGWNVIDELDGVIAIADILDGISAEEASLIAATLTTAGVQGTAMTVSGTTATADVDAPGVFYVAVTPADENDIIYNPVFVSADYYEGGTNSWTIDTSASYSPKTVAKKTPLTVKKDYDVEDTSKPYKDFAPGDEIGFQVKTNIPTYTDAYTDKKFNLTDVMDPGLSLVASSISVTVAGYSEADLTGKYTVNENKDPDGQTINGYSVVFDPEFLGEVVGNPEVTITYTGKISDDEDFLESLGNVTELDNEVKLDFTHKYDGTSKEIPKITRHYTFGIDAKLLGESGSYELENTEDLVKVGVDANNNPIYVSHTTERRIDHENTTVAALEQAHFTLTAVEGDCMNSATKTWDIVTNELGEISAVGLDAGVYSLVETSAPSGFIIDTTTHYVAIIPHYENDADGIPYLVDYQIGWADSIEAAKTSIVKTYTMSNDDPQKKLTGIKSSHIQGSDTQINNTQGSQLPSTGGIGTTIFYIIGAILVLGSGVVLVTRRRMSVN